MYNFVYIDGVVAIAGPPGYKVNLAHPTQQYNITAYIIFGIGVPLSTLFMVQYLYVKLRLVRTVDSPLVLLVLGWIVALAMASIQLHNFATKAIGVHIWEMPALRAVSGAKMLVAVTALNAVTTGLCKTSLGIFYYRVSPATWWKWANGASIFLMAGYNIAIFAAILLGCQPIEKNWRPTLPGVCINRPALYIARAALGVFSDLLLLILPIPMIMKLQMPNRQKIGVIVFFAIGSVTLVTAALRVALLKPTLNTRDSSWDSSSSAVVILSESQLIVICAALPTMKQFLSHVAPGLISERGSSAKSSKSSGQRNEVKIRVFKTIGRSLDRKKVDKFGMTINDDGICLSAVEPPWDVDTEIDDRSDRSDGSSPSYDTIWLETICEESFNKSYV